MQLGVHLHGSSIFIIVLFVTSLNVDADFFLLWLWLQVTYLYFSFDCLSWDSSVIEIALDSRLHFWRTNVDIWLNFRRTHLYSWLT